MWLVARKGLNHSEEGVWIVMTVYDTNVWNCYENWVGFQTVGRVTTILSFTITIPRNTFSDLQFLVTANCLQKFEQSVFKLSIINLLVLQLYVLNWLICQLITITWPANGNKSWKSIYERDVWSTTAEGEYLLLYTFGTFRTKIIITWFTDITCHPTTTILSN